jgi:hypothetical protein
LPIAGYISLVTTRLNTSVRQAARKLIHDGAWQNQLDLLLTDELFQDTKQRLLLIILGKVKPNASVY